MANFLAFVAGGAAEGYGEGVKAQALERREMRLLELQRQFQTEDRLATQEFNASENEKNRALQREMAPIKHDTFRLMTPEEKKANGLDPSKPFQIGSDGKVSAIGGEGTTVNVGGERGFDKTVGEEYGKRFVGLQDDEKSARRAINALNIMERSMEDPNFYSGTGSGTVTTLKRAARALGIEGADGIDSMEAFNAMAKQAALDSMGGSLGTGFSNADRDFVEGQVPTLANTPEGNRLLIDIQKKIAERKVQVAALARDYAKRNEGRIDAGFDEELAQWANSNPLFEAAGPAGNSVPKAGDVLEGYRFKGGNPADQSNWEKVQ